MKNLKLILLLIYIILISCSKKQDLKREKKFNDSLIVYSEEDLYKIKTGRIKVIDTLCINEEKKAKEDIKKGKLVYSFYFGLGNFEVSNAEMIKLLSKYNISVDTISGVCSRPLKGFKWNCYKNLMNETINKKFGVKFIDSLRKIADREFIKNNPNFIFGAFDCDTTSRYVTAINYNDFLEKPENDFINGLNYRKIRKTEIKKQKANTEVFFVIFKNGSIGNIKIKSDFSISKNKDFAKYFEKEAINFVKKAKWKPAKYRGIDVNSQMYLNLYNK